MGFTCPTGSAAKTDMLQGGSTRRVRIHSNIKQNINIMNVCIVVSGTKWDAVEVREQTVHIDKSTGGKNDLQQHSVQDAQCHLDGSICLADRDILQMQTRCVPRAGNHSVRSLLSEHQHSNLHALCNQIRQFAFAFFCTIP
jgi:hypothetical protein